VNSEIRMIEKKRTGEVGAATEISRSRSGDPERTVLISRRRNWFIY
jgi:hypothetical protein